MKNPAKMITAIAIGVVAGSVVSLLFAPDAGKNTRKKIAKKGDTALKNIKGEFNKARLDKIKNKLESKLEKVNSKIAAIPGTGTV